MFAWGASMNRNSTPKILSDPNAKLETVLADRTFNNLLRNENQYLIDFLIRDDNVKKMHDYLLTDSYENTKDFKKIRPLCLNVLTSESEKLGEQLSSNEQYIDLLIDFSTSEWFRDPYRCGNYSYLIESLAKASSGDILSSKFTFLANYLMNNIDIMGLRQLFVRLVCDFSYPFMVSSQMMDELVNCIFMHGEESNDETLKYTKIDPKALFVAFTIHDILKTDPHLGSLFESPDTLQTLLKLAIFNYEKNPLFSSLLFNCISIILENAIKNEDSASTQNDNEIINFNNFEPTLNINTNTEPFISNSATSEALKLFPKSAINLVMKFLKSELPTLVCDVVMSSICKLPIEELQSFCTKFHLSSAIISLYKDYKHRKTNGHFLILVKYLSDKGVCCCEEHREAWTKFEQCKFTKRYKKSMAEYGGVISTEASKLQRDLFKSMDDLYSAYLLLEEEEEEESSILESEKQQDDKQQDEKQQDEQK
ncbi:hypothetical protein M9Y10_028075 [Tritrichomonas musculus]|uniref:Uncharacterized protein n=1 Tax=Tritrichomonas musculus TaxID=1915356 RepID=A0ABR2KIF8_9EUKA